MSPTPNDLRRTSVPIRTWYLKSPDGSVQGPATLAELTDWAAEGRITGGCDVSVDGQAWSPAENMPDLRMVWRAETPDGKAFGPFNLLALTALTRHGLVAPNAVLRNEVLDKTVNVAELMGTSTG